MVQKKEELEQWYSKEDPWGYEVNSDDAKRRDIILSEIPKKNYNNVLDIGCGEGFITAYLPSKKIVGVDISSEALKRAKERIKNVNNKEFFFQENSLFDLVNYKESKFDLIVITGVLYKQYIGDSLSLVYQIIDGLLEDNGILISVHIDSWYKARFPYYLVKEIFYDYRGYSHLLEVYVK